MKFNRCLTAAVLCLWCCVNTPVAEGVTPRFAKSADKKQLEPSPIVNRLPAAAAAVHPPTLPSPPAPSRFDKLKQWWSRYTRANVNVQRDLSPQAELELISDEINAAADQVCRAPQLEDVVNCPLNPDGREDVETRRDFDPAATPEKRRKDLLEGPLKISVTAELMPKKSIEISVRDFSKGGTRLLAEKIQVIITHDRFKNETLRTQFLQKEAKNIDTLAALGFGPYGVDFVNITTNKPVLEKYQVVKHVRGALALPFFEYIFKKKEPLGSLYKIQKNIRELRIVNAQLAVMERIKQLHAQNYTHCHLELTSIFFKRASSTDLKSYSDWRPFNQKDVEFRSKLSETDHSVLLENIRKEIEKQSSFVTGLLFDGSETTILLAAKNVRFLHPIGLEKVSDLGKTHCMRPDGFQRIDVVDAVPYFSRDWKELSVDVKDALMPLKYKQSAKEAITVADERRYLEEVITILSTEKSLKEATAFNVYV